MICRLMKLIARPCILQYICRQNNIICICLDSYIANRAQLLTAVMNECKITKDEAKILFITSLNKDTEVLLINKKQKIKNRLRVLKGVWGIRGY